MIVETSKKLNSDELDVDLNIKNKILCPNVLWGLFDINKVSSYWINAEDFAVMNLRKDFNYFLKSNIKTNTLFNKEYFIVFDSKSYLNFDDEHKFFDLNISKHDAILLDFLRDYLTTGYINEFLNLMLKDNYKYNLNDKTLEFIKPFLFYSL